MSKRPVKIGMMSFAHMHALSYASALKQLPDVEFAGIADDDASRAKEMAGKFDVKPFDTYEAMLSTDIDGVIVCSENINHRRHVALAAQSNKHIMCEKPLSVSKEDAHAMVEVCHRAEVKLMTAFPCRYHPAFKRMKAAVDAGELGKILAVKATNQGMCPWGWFVDKKLSGGGAVIDHTVHVLDLMRCLTGAEPVRVYAEIDNRMYGKDFDDTGVLTVDFSNGMFATIDASWSRPKSNPFWGNVKMEVTGQDGAAYMDMFNQKLDAVSDKTSHFSWEYWGDNIDLALVEAFTKAIAEDKPTDITGEDGLAAVEVALAAYQSAELGVPVELPI